MPSSVPHEIQNGRAFRRCAHDRQRLKAHFSRLAFGIAEAMP
jgi:hypothetical protein